MHPSRIALWIGLAAGIAAAREVGGRIVAAEDGLPIPGVRVRLLAHGDSAVTDSAGMFLLNPDGSGLRPPLSPMSPALRPRLRSGMLEYAAARGEAARIDLFGTDGKLLRSLSHRPASAGIQKVALAPITGALSGVGWLRLSAAGRSDWIRFVSLGEGMEPIALARPEGPAPSSLRPSSRTSSSTSTPTPALGKTALRYIDTLLVEKAGFYPDKEWIQDDTGLAEPYRIALRKNSIYGMDPAEIEAWKAHLTGPAMTLQVSLSGIGFPAGLNEGTVELADGTVASGWLPDRCHPGPRPKSVRMAYTRQGREYRDTVRLDSIWKLIDSFRATGADTLNLRTRVHLAWDWPKGYSVAPERDWMELMLVSGFAEYHAISHPDVFQYGAATGIEGGTTVYDPFDPALGAWVMQGPPGTQARFAAEITLARREDHDLRLSVDDHGRPETPLRFAFLNAWPDGGIIPAGQVLRVQAESQPASVFTEPTSGPGPVGLELIPEGAEEGPFLKYPWDGSALALPFPVRDTLAFRLKVWVTDQLRTLITCQTPLLSPLLRAVPSATDTAAGAFEPNDSPAYPAPIPMGQWLEAAWDFRVQGGPDEDYYRFQAPAGARIRLGLRNPNSGKIQAYGNSADRYGGIEAGDVMEAEGGSEKSVEFTVKDAGDYVFTIAPVDFHVGRYAFRIDILP